MQTEQPETKTALVLSSGGLFGAYQVGAWSFLSESSLKPDLIVGASVGALNGWAMAAKADPADLVEQWLDERTSRILQMRANPGLMTGYFEGAPLREFAEEIFSRYQPVIDFGLVIIELPFLRSRLIRHQAVTAEHLLATASIPLAMPSVSIGGKTFTDGGLLEDVPLWAAVRMGATRIVAIDAMHYEAPWWYRAGVTPMKMLAPRISGAARAQTLIIRPTRPLGPYSEAIAWKRAKIKEWVERGYEDARRAFKLHAAVGENLVSRA